MRPGPSGLPREEQAGRGLSGWLDCTIGSLGLSAWSLAAWHLAWSQASDDRWGSQAAQAPTHWEGHLSSREANIRSGRDPAPRAQCSCRPHPGAGPSVQNSWLLTQHLFLRSGPWTAPLGAQLLSLHRLLLALHPVAAPNPGLHASGTYVEGRVWVQGPAPCYRGEHVFSFRVTKSSPRSLDRDRANLCAVRRTNLWGVQSELRPLLCPALSGLTSPPAQMTEPTPQSCAYSPLPVTLLTIFTASLAQQPAPGGPTSS